MDQPLQLLAIITYIDEYSTPPPAFFSPSLPPHPTEYYLFVSGETALHQVPKKDQRNCF